MRVERGVKRDEFMGGCTASMGNVARRCRYAQQKIVRHYWLEQLAPTRASV